MTVLVVDCGLGNLASIGRALEEIGAKALISDRPADLELASHIVLPGVGAFADAMNRLQAQGWPQALHRSVIDEGVPLLGICLGMQLLATFGEEGHPVAGLGFISGHVRKLKPMLTKERIPHVGWNEVQFQLAHPLFHGIPNGADFYFVHSYHFVPDDPTVTLGRTPYCGSFVSVIGNGQIFGVQFHPEKSARHGLQLLRNFMDMGLSHA